MLWIFIVVVAVFKLLFVLLLLLVQLLWEGFVCCKGRTRKFAWLILVVFYYFGEVTLFYLEDFCFVYCSCFCCSFMLFRLLCFILLLVFAAYYCYGLLLYFVLFFIVVIVVAGGSLFPLVAVVVVVFLLIFVVVGFQILLFWILFVKFWEIKLKILFWLVFLRTEKICTIFFDLLRFLLFCFFTMLF